MTTARLLSLITRVDGVVGCFVGSRRGALLARRMPTHYGNSDLVLAMSQSAELVERAPAHEERAEFGVVNFGTHQLLIQRFSQGYLCVLSYASVDQPALDATVQRVAKHLNFDETEAETLRPPRLNRYADDSLVTRPLVTLDR